MENFRAEGVQGLDISRSRFQRKKDPRLFRVFWVVGFGFARFEDLRFSVLRLYFWQLGL